MPNLDYLQALKIARQIKDNARGYPEIKLAVLGDSSTQQLVQVLKAVLHRHGLFAKIYEAEFNVVDQEVFNEKSGLYAFAPEYVFLHVSMQSLRDRYYRERQPGEAFARAARARVEGWWEALAARLPCRIIQGLYQVPLERPFGNYSSRVPDSLGWVVSETNRRLTLAAQKRAQVFPIDVDYVAALEGRARFSDEKLWVHAKMFCNPEYLPQVAENVAGVILAGAGKARKCLVLDLDNTLWGGVIGEDGLDGIEIGEKGAGEAFALFQHFLLSLKNRGLILAVCSKNDLENAREPFRRHPDMVLREKDISLFVANWSNKGDNIRGIASALNIGTDSLVFVDDSPFERNQVRAMLPEVLVPEMPEDPAEFVPFLSRFNFLEALSFSEEDRQRADYYREQAGRDQEKVKFSSIDDYLRSLGMEATFSRFDPFHLPRITQLIQRSNQFNLTTKRYNEKDCEAFMNDERGCFPVAVSLRDKFGDYGLIAVIILKLEPEAVLVDSWLMSCRVLSRGVERFCMNHVAAFAASKGRAEIRGAYIPTAKNGMVKNFYADFGFKKEGASGAGETLWSLKVKDYRPEPVFIERREEAKNG